MIVVVGLDNTLSDDRWRLPVITDKGWEAYHALCPRDEPVEVMKKMIRAMVAEQHRVVAVTSRPERWRMATNKWLLDKEVPVDDLLMRGNTDFRPAPLVKLDAVRKLLGDDRPELVIDDRDDVVAAFRDGGSVACLQFLR